jgi:hypothetical protein
VVTVNLARDYAASLAGEEQILDGDRKERSCLKLRLAATHPEAVYHRIEYWVEKGTHHPIKGTFHSDSGRLLKTAYFRKYERHMGRLRPTEIVIVDGLAPQWVTLMHFSGYHPRTIPDAWFRLDGLPTFNE